jgi:hypothetical protein
MSSFAQFSEWRGEALEPPMIYKKPSSAATEYRPS